MVRTSNAILQAMKECLLVTDVSKEVELDLHTLSPDSLGSSATTIPPYV